MVVLQNLSHSIQKKKIYCSLYWRRIVCLQSQLGRSGVLFTLQTAVERTVYDYVGSGRIFGFNNLEEKKVYDYNCSSIVPFPENDYGFIINTGAIACVDVDGVISTSETTTSGCIKVLNSLTVNQGVTYSVRPQNTIASNILDYGLVPVPASPLADFGDILGTPRLGLPGCIYGHIDITGASVNSLAPNWISQGGIRLFGEGRVPLDVTVFGSGIIRKLGGDSITNSVFLDLAMVYSDSIVNLRLESVLVYLAMDLSQLSVVLQNLLLSIQTKEIYYSLSMEKDRLPSIPTGLVVVSYSLYKLQLKELYMITLVLVDSLDSTILRKSRFTVTTVVPLYHSPNQIMDLLLIQMQFLVLMLMVLFLQIPHLQLDVPRYSIR